MLTNIQLVLDIPTSAIDIGLSDRHGQLNYKKLVQDNNEVKFNFGINFPNQLIFSINGVLPGQCVQVKEMWVGTLKLPESIVCQIFSFVDHSGSEMIVHRWPSNGTATVNLFAEDWVQYHLLYGNKILSD